MLNRIRVLGRRIHGLVSRRRLDEEFQQELDTHLEMLTEENLRRGLPPEEARRMARVQLGGVTQLREIHRELWTFPFLETFAQDIRYGLRQLRRNPGFTAVAILTLALGIGANTAIFSVVNAVVLRPLPYPHSDRLVWIAESIPALKSEVATGGDYVDWKDESHTLDRIAAYDRGVRAEGRKGTSDDFNLTGRGTPARVHGVSVSASFFATLGVEPQLGRAFTENEDQPNGPHVAVLMHSFWQQYFGSDPQVLGQTVILDSAPYTVVGVMPASFRLPGNSGTQILVPLALNQAGERLRSQAQRLVWIIGRLKPGVSLAAARADLDEIRKQAQPSGRAAQNPSAKPHRSEAETQTVPRSEPSARFRRGPIKRPATELIVTPLAEHLAGNLRPAVLTLMGVVGLVLLIACANVANLMLTRASARTREVAVRAALGAGRWRLVRQLLAESVTLALAGGVAGLLLAAWSVDVIARLIPAGTGGGILAVAAPKVDGNVLLFALAASLFTGILFGLAPAVAFTRPDLAEGLKEGAHVASPGGRGWLRGGLAVAELSIALMLLIGAGLLIKSFYRVLQVDPGFAPERVLTLGLSLTDARYPAARQKSEFFSQVLRRVESLPGVRSAALTDSLPLSPYQGLVIISPSRLLPRAALSSSTRVMMMLLRVSPGYFYTLGIPVLKGRTFTDQDNEQAPKVVVINEALASHLWPAEDPIGKKLPLMKDNLTVIGVVGNTRHEGLSQETRAEICVPYLQMPANSMRLAVRTTAPPDSLVSAVRAQVRAVDPDEPLSHVATLEQTLSESLAPRRLNMLLLGIFAGIALTLATVGIYGVMAYSVRQRTHEIGIRMALGAERRNVLGLIVRQGLRLTLIGVALGVAGAWALTSFLASFLFGVAPRDPATFVLVSLALVAVSILACYIPARRAARVDPMVALRYE